MARRSICCVLKSGGDFVPSHVEWLRQQCAQHMPGWDFRVWSDMPVRGAEPLFYDWPKWWAKMHIYSNYLGPALVIDLDTVFLKPLQIKPEHKDKAIIIRDPWKNGFRHPERLAGGFMYLPEWAQERIRAAWWKDPEGIVSRCGGNDQIFLHELFHKDALRFQDHYPDEIVSYKVHVKGLGLRSDNKVVYFHGEPRPWQLKEPWIPCWPPACTSPAVELTPPLEQPLLQTLSMRA